MINLNLKDVYVNALLADAVYVDSLLKINSVDEQDGLIHVWRSRKQSLLLIILKLLPV